MKVWYGIVELDKQRGEGSQVGKNGKTGKGYGEWKGERGFVS